MVGGAPKGNLNRARSILPALKRLKLDRPLPEKLARVVAIAEREAQELVSDRGGEQAMSGAEILMIANWTAARRAELLILTELLERGAIKVDRDGTWDLQPGLQRLTPFLSVQRHPLLHLVWSVAPSRSRICAATSRSRAHCCSAAV